VHHHQALYQGGHPETMEEGIQAERLSYRREHEVKRRGLGAVETHENNEQHGQVQKRNEGQTVNRMGKNDWMGFSNKGHKDGYKRLDGGLPSFTCERGLWYNSINGNESS